MHPRLLIADEATTALDVSTQNDVLHLIKELQAEAGISLILITHNLDVAAAVCDRTAVMYAGEIVETRLERRPSPGAAASIHGGSSRSQGRCHASATTGWL